MKFGKIELTDWKLRLLPGWQTPDLVKYVNDKVENYNFPCIIMYTSKTNIVHTVRFLSPLSDLKKIFNPHDQNHLLNWDIESAKQTVDDFLIKMNNLRVFL